MLEPSAHFTPISEKNFFQLASWSSAAASSPPLAEPPNPPFMSCTSSAAPLMRSAKFSVTSYVRVTRSSVVMLSGITITTGPSWIWNLNFVTRQTSLSASQSETLFAAIAGMRGMPSALADEAESPLSALAAKSFPESAAAASPPPCATSCLPRSSTKLKPRWSIGMSGRSKSREACLKYSTASAIVAGGLNEIEGRIISFMRFSTSCSIVRSLSSPRLVRVVPPSMPFSSREFTA